MKLRIVALTTGALVASAGAIALAAGPSPSITGGVLGSGVLTGTSSTNVHLSRSRGFVMENGNFPPGSTAGWHSHRTVLVGAVTAGTITLYDSSGRKCTPHRYHAGQGFIEPANHLHLARNEGNTTASLDFTYIGVSPRLRANPNDLDVLNQKRPHKCPVSVQ
jgi:quercetin dioxygenase-like cupin family protein